jgi:hypothetical protein
MVEQGSAPTKNTGVNERLIAMKAGQPLKLAITFK